MRPPARVDGRYDGRWERFNAPVGDGHDRASSQTLQADEPLDALLPVFDRDHVAIVIDGDEFLGLDHPHRPAQLSAGARAMTDTRKNRLAFVDAHASMPARSPIRRPAR